MTTLTAGSVYSTILFRLVGLLDDPPDDWHTLTSASPPRLVTFVNPLTVSTLCRRSDFFDRLSRFDHVFADGILLALVAGYLRGRPLRRAAFDGNSVAPAVFIAARRERRPIYFIGGPNGAAEKAAALFHRTFGVTVAGAEGGHFANADERRAALARIVATGAPIVVVGMGSYIQECFLLDLVAAGWCGTGFTCGAYLEQAARRNAICYYPTIINRIHLRALFRLLQEPRRLLPRYTKHYMPFYLAAASLLWGTSSVAPTRNGNVGAREPRT